MLQTGERHVADGDVRLDSAVPPMEDRPDLQVVLVGAETGLDLRQAAVLGDQVPWIGLAAAPSVDSPQAVPGGGRGDSVLVQGHPVAWMVREPGGGDCVTTSRHSPSAMQRRRP